LIAQAGPVQSAVSGDLVVLNGLLIDPDETGGPYYYHWEQIGGTPVFLSGRNLPEPSFLAPVVIQSEDLIFELRVSRAPIGGSTVFSVSESDRTLVQVVPLTP